MSRPDRVDWDIPGYRWFHYYTYNHFTHTLLLPLKNPSQHQRASKQYNTNLSYFDRNILPFCPQIWATHPSDLLICSLRLWFWPSHCLAVLTGDGQYVVAFSESARRTYSVSKTSGNSLLCCGLSEDRDMLINQLSTVRFLPKAEAGAVVLPTTSKTHSTRMASGLLWSHWRQQNNRHYRCHFYNHQFLFTQIPPVTF
jgi:hypothetical protein